MEIAVTCPSCKSTYRFDEEPVGGRLRSPVQCTNCGSDGTSAANEYIRKSLSGELEKERQRNNVWWKKIGKTRDEEDASASADLPPQQPGKVPTALGVIGAIIGGLLGLVLWTFVVAKTGREIGFVAWAVGILAGAGARLFVRNGNFTVASTAALCAFLAIMGGQVFAMKSMYDKVMGSEVRRSYKKALAYAKEASVAKSDDDFKKLFVTYPEALETFRYEERESGTDRDKKLIELGYTFMSFSHRDDENGATIDQFVAEPDMDLATAEEISRYKQEDLPILVDLAKGKPSQNEFEKQLKGSVFQATTLNEMVADSWSPYQLLWIVLGVCSAYKLGYNKSETEDV